MASEDVLFGADILSLERVSGYRGRDAVLVQPRGSESSDTGGDNKQRMSGRQRRHLRL